MEDLLKLALIGTSRDPTALEATGHAADALAATVEAAHEKKLLLRAAASHLFLIAGQLAKKAPALPEPAALDSCAACSLAAADMLAEMFPQSAQDPTLLLEALALVREAGIVLTPALLPKALEAKRKNIRTALLPVLGERGRWLAKFNADWKWVLEAGSGTATEAECLPSDADRVWQEVNFATRLELLAQARRLEPARGRLWLQGAWDSEKAEQRLGFLTTFVVGLSADDAAFLEEALRDRSGSVRAKAAELLALQPGSGLSQRMRERALAMLDYTPPKKRAGLVGAIGSFVGRKEEIGRLQITPPQEFGKEWAQDGLEAKPPRGMGERAYWLTHDLG